MKWFNLLKNRTGKLTLNMQSAVVLSIGIGILGVSIVRNVSDNMPKQELTARSLSSISNAYDYGGLRRTKEGLSAMNMANLSGGLDGIASAEERARIEAARTGNGQFGLDAADNMGRNVASAMSGSAAQTGDSEGLGMSKNAVVMQNNASGTSAANTPTVSSGAVAQQGQNARNARGASNTLAPASARTAGGSGVSNSGFGGSSSSGANRSGSSSYSGSSARGEGYRLSGAMPGGTNPVSMRGADGRSSSGFGAGRDATVGQGQRFKSTGNELKDISRHSAKIAASAHKAANAGIEPFLAKNTTASGLDMKGVEEMTTESSDVYEAEIPRQEQATEQYQEDLTDYTTKRSEDFARLMDLLKWLLAATLVLIPTAIFLLNMNNIYATIGGYALLAFLSTFVFNFDWAANEFRKAYGANASSMPKICDYVSAGVLTLVALAALPPTRKWIADKLSGLLKFLFESGISLTSSQTLSKIYDKIYNKK